MRRQTARPVRPTDELCALQLIAEEGSREAKSLSPIILGRHAADLCPHLVAWRHSIATQCPILHGFQILFKLLEFPRPQYPAIRCPPLYDPLGAAPPPPAPALP